MSNSKQQTIRRLLLIAGLKWRHNGDNKHSSLVAVPGLGGEGDLLACWPWEQEARRGASKISKIKSNTPESGRQTRIDGLVQRKKPEIVRSRGCAGEPVRRQRWRGLRKTGGWAVEPQGCSVARVRGASVLRSVFFFAAGECTATLV